MIHYHGTPITPRTRLLEGMAGRAFCVSFAAPGDVTVCHEIGQTVMLDNGAFSMWRLGKPTDWPAYYEWASPWLEHWTTWAVIPDVIAGDSDANDELIEAWPFGHRGAPVWHLHEPLGRLERLAREWPLLCLGSSGDYSRPGSPRWNLRMVEAMDVVCNPAGVPLTRLHMLRGLNFGGGPYPFFSADSTNVARNHAGSARRAPKDIRGMAEAIDAQQTPARWSRPGARTEALMGQQALPYGQREYPNECAICGASPATPHEVRPGSYGQVTRMPVVVPLCAAHLESATSKVGPSEPPPEQLTL